MILLIDNYDSFTYNLYQYLGQLGESVEVHRNDQISLGEIAQMNPDHIILSPGPCRPIEAGICLSVIQKFYSMIPMLGICLGHQSIGAAFGGVIRKAKMAKHGKIEPVLNDQQGVYVDLPSTFNTVLYHSLVIDEASLPDELEVTARSVSTDEIMGVRHRRFPIEGVQFHPESILSEHGYEILSNFLKNNKGL